MAAKMALTMVNLEVGLDYWLPGDAHQELQRVQDGRQGVRQELESKGDLI